jgi:ATP-dependent exoDNAse (exonuclease V) beta subunit
VIGDPVDLGERIRLDGVDDVTRLGLVMHSLIAAEIQMSDDDHATRSKQQLSEWGFGESVDARATLAAVRRFIDWINENLQPTAWLPEHPVTHVLPSGQVINGFIDLLLETKNGWVIIDHKATPRPRNEWKEVARVYSGQLLAYKQAIEAATDQPVFQTWLHFPVGGGLIELSLAT